MSKSMLALLKKIITVVVISFAAVQLQAAPASLAGQQDGARLERLAQADPYGIDRAACPFGQHYACWYQPYGSRFCGCWLGGDRPACPSEYHLACRLAPNGYPYCACY